MVILLIAEGLMSLQLVFAEGYFLSLLTLVCIGAMYILHYVHAIWKRILAGLVFTGLGIFALVQFWRAPLPLYVRSLEELYFLDYMGRIWLLALGLYIAILVGGVIILSKSLRTKSTMTADHPRASKKQNQQPELISMHIHHWV